MDPNRLGNRHRKIFVMAAMSLLLMGIALFYLHQREQREVLNQLAARQLLLTSRTAGNIEQFLQNLQKGLSHLAAGGDTLLQSPRMAAAQLSFLSRNYPRQILTALYVKDLEGNILAEAPPNQMAAISLPVHLLPNDPDFFSSPRLFSLAEEQFLLLGQSVMVDGERQADVAALISLDDLKAFCLASSSEQSDIYFLIDESGTFLLHGNPDLIGRSFTEVVSPEEQPGLLDLFYSMTRGERGIHRYRDSSSAAGTAGEGFATEHILTYTPVEIPGARWSLALALPADVMTAQTHSDARFRLTLAFGLLCLSLLTFPACRFLRRIQQLAAERDLYREESGRLHGELERSQRRYRHLWNNAGDAIFFIEPQSGALQEINRHAEELLGYTAEEIRSLSLSVLLPGWQRRRYLRLVKRVLKDGYGEERNLTFRRKDGGLFTGAVHARLGELGEAQVVHGTVRDVTQIVRIEQELRQRNRDLALVNEIAHRAAGSRNLHDMLHAVLAQVIRTFAADGGGIYLMHDNESTLKLAAHEGVGEELFKDLEHLPPGIGLAGRVAASGQPRTSADIQKDHRVRSQAAREAGWRGFQAIPLAANERTAGVLFLFNFQRRTLSREELRLLLAIGKQVGTSVEGAQLYEALQWQHRLTKASNRELESSRQQLREALTHQEEANRTLERLDQIKSNFLALASHELRTPLTYVLSSSEFLSQTVTDRLSEEERRLLETIHLGGKRLHEIVGDLLEVARLESQNLYLGRERLDLPALIEEVGASFLPLLGARELSFTVGPFPQPLPFVGDPDHLHKTVHRLLENAVKFTPRGGGIEIRGERRTAADVRAMEPLLLPFSPSFFGRELEGHFLQMTVSDTGIGIDPEEQVRIFDKFYEVGDIASHFTSQTEFGGKGVGMGLTLVKGMVEAHGGMVWVESPGTDRDMAGSTFHLLLPLAEETEEALDATG